MAREENKSQGEVRIKGSEVHDADDGHRPAHFREGAAQTRRHLFRAQ